MNQNSHYRTTLPHQIHHVQCAPVQSFPARFAAPNPLDALNPMIPPPVAPVDTQYHAHLQPFLTNRPNDLLKVVEQQKQTTDRNFSLQSDRSGQENYKPTTSTPSSETFVPHCNQGAKNCLQCYNKAQSPQNQQPQTTSRNGKLMVDAATMTDLEEIDQSAWQNVSVPPNTKVAEYLTSLRQFLKVILFNVYF